MKRVGSYVLGAAACALLFVIPSAYATVRGAGYGAAMAVGLLAFPIVPVGWHLFAERRRKRAAAAAKAPKAGSLTATDRFTLRLIAVAVVAIGPFLALDASNVWRGVRDHATWFIPSGDPIAGVPADMVERVPAEAEAVIVVRAASGLFGRVADLELGGAVLAMADGKAMLVARPAIVNPAVIARLTGLIGGISERAVDPIEVRTEGPFRIAASSSWRHAGGGPNPAIRAELARAPASAVLAIGVAPVKVRDALSVRAAALWVTASATEVVIEGRVEALDEDKATRFEAQARAALPMLGVLAPPGCREDAAAIAGAIVLARSGALITARVAISRPRYDALAACAD
jgi:hypothetical protein